MFCFLLVCWFVCCCFLGGAQLSMILKINETFCVFCLFVGLFVFGLLLFFLFFLAKLSMILCVFHQTDELSMISVS